MKVNEDYNRGIRDALRVMDRVYNRWIKFSLVVPAVNVFANEVRFKIFKLKKEKKENEKNS